MAIGAKSDAMMSPCKKNAAVVGCSWEGGQIARDKPGWDRGFSSLYYRLRLKPLQPQEIAVFQALLVVVSPTRLGPSRNITNNNPFLGLLYCNICPVYAGLVCLLLLAWVCLAVRWVCCCMWPQSPVLRPQAAPPGTRLT